ncbi:MAG: YfhO family protein [Lachnospiraceae bacterium]|nr:YfhO family protein [Lachnospiraceae bacterium]
MSKNKSEGTIKVKKNSLSFEERLPMILSFALPVLIMIAVCAAKGIWPFGNMSFLRTDLYHQYCPFYTELAGRLKSGGSLTYAWDIGLGSNYLALVAYYLFCPTQLLLFIIPDSLIIEYITLMIILKISLSGYAMAKYLSLKFNTRSLGIAFFAICYALSGYMAAYSWNIMWLDVIWLAPLVLLGVERLFKENKPLLYCITLALCILTNYYISIMLSMFIVLYAIAQLIMLPRQRFTDYLKKIGLFTLYSLIAGAISAVILIPAAYALFSTASAKTTFPSELTSYFPLIKEFARHLVNIECETGLDHWPNIYCGVATLLFLPMYYMNSRVNYKEKIVKTVLLFIMLVSFSFNIPNYIWHGLHYPNSLPARQSFLYIILLLTMCFEGFKGFKRISKGRLAGCLFGVIGFIFLCECICDTSEIQYHTYYVSLIFVALYVLFLYLYRAGKMRSIVAFTSMLALLVIELGVNTAVTSVLITNRDTYNTNKAEYRSLIDSIEDEDFYRVEKASRRTKNDGAFVGYESASIFSSTTHAGVTAFYKKLGMEGNTNAYAFTGATPFAASMLSVKYVLSDKKLPDSPLYRLYADTNGVYLYENLYTLPLGFMIPEDTDSLWAFTSTNPAKAQNSLANILSEDITELMTQIPGASAGSEYSTTVTERSHVFVYISNTAVKNVTAYVNEKSYSFNDVNRGYLLDLGVCEAGADVSVSGEDDTENLNAVAYAFNDDEFLRLYERLSESPLKLTEFNSSLTDTSLSGTVNAAESGALLLSIPYDEGWTVKVDGRVAKAEAFSGALMMIRIEKGEHLVSLSYTPRGLVPGAIISGVGLLALILSAVLYKLLGKRPEDGDEETEGADDISAEAAAGQNDVFDEEDEVREAPPVAESEEQPGNDEDGVFEDEPVVSDLDFITVELPDDSAPVEPEKPLQVDPISDNPISSRQKVLEQILTDLEENDDESRD